MNRRVSLWAGAALCLVGIVTLGSNVVLYRFGPEVWRLPWRFWPLTVVAIGLLLVAAPFLARKRRGLGGLFIPGVPLLATGGVLLFTSVFNAWSAWDQLWPLEVLSVGLGFLFAAIYTRVVWLAIPGIIVGINGLLFQFCAVTGWWSAWSVLWTFEPLAVGLALLVPGILKRSTALVGVAVGLLGFGGLALLGTTALASVRVLWSGSWLINLAGPVIILAAGLLLLILGVVQPRTPAVTVAEQEG